MTEPTTKEQFISAATINGYDCGAPEQWKLARLNHTVRSSLGTFFQVSDLTIVKKNISKSGPYWTAYSLLQRVEVQLGNKDDVDVLE